MADYTLNCFAQLRNAFMAALMLNLCGVAWAAYPHLANGSERFKDLSGWQHPYDLMPGHPLPATS